MLTVFVGLLGLWTVWQQVQIVRTGYRCDTARRRIETLRNEKAQLEFQVGRLRAPEAIHAKKAAFQICVSEPTAGSVVTVGELREIVNASEAGQLSAARRRGASAVRAGSGGETAEATDRPRRRSE
jgi:hypothetical protein